MLPRRRTALRPLAFPCYHRLSRLRFCFCFCSYSYFSHRPTRQEATAQPGSAARSSSPGIDAVLAREYADGLRTERREHPHPPTRMPLVVALVAVLPMRVIVHVCCLCTLYPMICGLAVSSLFSFISVCSPSLPSSFPFPLSSLTVTPFSAPYPPSTFHTPHPSISDPFKFSLFLSSSAFSLRFSLFLHCTSRCSA